MIEVAPREEQQVVKKSDMNVQVKCDSCGYITAVPRKALKSAKTKCICCHKGRYVSLWKEDRPGRAPIQTRYSGIHVSIK